MCTSCIPGWQFTGWNCISNFYYIYDVVLQAQLSYFFSGKNYQKFINELTYALQTSNMKAINIISVNQIQWSNGAAAVNISVNLSTLQTTSSAQKTEVEYQNLQFALNRPQIGGMNVLWTYITSIQGQPQSTYSPTPAIVGIVVPLGILVFMGLVYFVCSRSNMDIPGAYIEVDSMNTGRDTELKAM